MNIIDGFQIPTDADDLRDWYSYACDQVATMDGDDMGSKRERFARRELAAAKQAMRDAGLLKEGNGS